MISEINKPAGHGDLPRPLLFFIPQYHRKSTFFGHRDYPPTIKPAIKAAIEELVHNQSADMFYAGNNGQFDAYCRSVLKSLGINYAVVLYGMPGKPSEYKDFSDTMLPEGIVVTGPAHFTPERRNRWMVNQSQFLICFLKQRMYVRTAKFVALAERKRLTVINLFQKQPTHTNKVLFQKYSHQRRPFR